MGPHDAKQSLDAHGRNYVIETLYEPLATRLGGNPLWGVRQSRQETTNIGNTY